ncbi:prephenate dehydratase [Flavobacterium ardleyense]|uniref:prephenate dehydratase n=1 Tax=Flavobacterium ardleyense TaxID=2038737 RepID=A0ABW5Z6Z3_9FLAO
MEIKVAIQGILGSFHHQVAEKLYPKSVSIQECMTFNSLVNSILGGDAAIGIMALENSIAGSILPNYNLIDENDLQIIGEHYLDIDMNLMALKDQKIEDISEVHSHPIALLQCAVFFNKHPHIKIIESVDTAETAQRIKNNNLKGIAAVASSVAAEMYDLEILEKNIHTIKTNKTRFVIVKKNSEITLDNVNKASVKFSLLDTPGNLASILNVLNDFGLNVTKIQSVPIIQKPFEYAFFVDFIFKEYDSFLEVKSILETMTWELKLLGVYKNGNV